MLAIEETKKLYQKYYSNPNPLFMNQLKSNRFNIYLTNFNFNDISVINKILAKHFLFENMTLASFDPNKKEPKSSKKSQSRVPLTEGEKVKLAKQLHDQELEQKAIINKITIGVAKHLKLSDKLLSFRLVNFDLQKGLAEHLSKGIDENKSLQALSINNVKMEIDSYEILLKGLLSHEKLEYLDLNSNNLDDKFGNMISRIIARQTQRRDLVIWSYGLRNERPPTMDYTRGLISINLNNNNLSSYSAECITTSLSYDQYIRYISIQKNNLDSESCKKFIHMMRKNMTLLNVDLRLNPGYDDNINSRLVMKMSKNIRYLYQLYQEKKYTVEEFENFKTYIDISFFDLDIPQEIVEYYNNNLQEITENGPGTMTINNNVDNNNINDNKNNESKDNNNSPNIGEKNVLKSKKPPNATNAGNTGSLGTNIEDDKNKKEPPKNQPGTGFLGTISKAINDMDINDKKNNPSNVPSASLGVDSNQNRNVLKPNSMNDIQEREEEEGKIVTKSKNPKNNQNTNSNNKKKDNNNSKRPASSKNESNINNNKFNYRSPPMKREEEAKNDKLKEENLLLKQQIIELKAQSLQEKFGQKVNIPTEFNSKNFDQGYNKAIKLIEELNNLMYSMDKEKKQNENEGISKNRAKSANYNKNVPSQEKNESSSGKKALNEIIKTKNNNINNNKDNKKSNQNSNSKKKSEPNEKKSESKSKSKEKDKEKDQDKSKNDKNESTNKKNKEEQPAYIPKSSGKKSEEDFDFDFENLPEEEKEQIAQQFIFLQQEYAKRGIKFDENDFKEYLIRCYSPGEEEEEEDEEEKGTNIKK